MTSLEAIIVAIVEGLTEYLPVSSTGHMIIAESAMKLEASPFLKLFTVNIQFGAILAVLVLYYKRFLQSISFYFKLFVAFIPAAIIGLFLGDAIDSLLESVPVVATSLLLGGIVLVFIDKLFPQENFKQLSQTAEPTYFQGFIIGCFQCVALIPGVSRSAATIIGGLSQNLNRKNAAEFSFFLAVPTMFAASGYKMLKALNDTPEILNIENFKLLLLGNAVAFVVAIIAIKFFIQFLTKHGFKIFGYYRIALGLLLFALMALGVPLEMAS